MITLGRTRRTYVITLVALAVLVGAAATILVYPATFYSFTCGQFDIPEYEKAYGFTFSKLAATRPDGSVALVSGISAVDPEGAFARSGIRPGDIPETYHGLQDFCADIAWAMESDKSSVRVFNVYDEKAGKEPRREVLLGLRK